MQLLARRLCSASTAGASRAARRQLLHDLSLRRTTIIACMCRSTRVLTRTRYIPGARFSVSRATAAAIDTPLLPQRARGLLVRNRTRADGRRARRRAERSSISTFARGEIASGAAARLARRTRRCRRARCGVGRFNLGSTVVVLFARARGALGIRARDGRALRDGAALGRATRRRDPPMSYARGGIARRLAPRARDAWRGSVLSSPRAACSRSRRRRYRRPAFPIPRSRALWPTARSLEAPLYIYTRRPSTR